MKNLVLSFAIILTTFSISYAQHTDASLISVEKRDQWINKTSQELKNFIPDTILTSITIDRYVWDEGQKISCRVSENGIIRLDDGGWIYITTTSGHQNIEIGDISMAVDHKKNIYKNFGHVCGGIIHFESTQLTELTKTADFFKYFFSDTDSAAWEKVKF